MAVQMNNRGSSEKVSKGAVTHERILGAAADCFVQDGYRDTRMTRIAARCGISRAALYKYFPTKEAILLALNERVVKDALATSRAILSSRRPALAVIEAWMRDNLGNAQADFVRVLMFEDAQAVLMLDQEATDNALLKVKRALAKVIRRGIEQGHISPAVHPADTAHMLQALVFSIKRNNLSSRPVIEFREGRRVNTLITTVIAGLRAGA